jgi:hypothetical protein
VTTGRSATPARVSGTNILIQSIVNREQVFDRAIALGLRPHAGLAEAGVAPDWIAGVSIGAINAALIAGNLPEQRVKRLREFWERVSAHAPFVPPPSLDPMRLLFNFMKNPRGDTRR